MKKTISRPLCWLMGLLLASLLPLRAATTSQSASTSTWGSWPTAWSNAAANAINSSSAPSAYKTDALAVLTQIGNDANVKTNYTSHVGKSYSSGSATGSASFNKDGGDPYYYLDFTITWPDTQPVTFSFSNISFTYDGSSKTASVSPTPSGATYSSDLTKGPNAGSYTVSAAGTGTYSGSGSATLTINKANQGGLGLNAATTQTYGTSQTLSTSGGSGGGGVSYVITNWSAANNVSLSGAVLTANEGSGWVDIRADKSGDGNYNATSSGGVRIYLAAAAASFSFGNLTYTYDGSSKTASVTPSPSGATYSADLTKGPGAGSYTVSATANGNYSGSGSATLTINPANQSGLTLGASTTQAYGTGQTLSASGGSGGGGVSYVITDWSAANNVSLSGAVLTANASSGWVDVRADKAGDANYNATSSAVVRINLATIATSFSFSNLTYTYDGSSKTAAVTPSPGGATYSSDLTKGPGVGSYTVSATANGNYSGSGSATLTINQAGQTITFNQPATQTYGAALNPGATVSSALAVSYSIVSGPATVAGSTINFTGTGSVTVRASQAGDANYAAATSVDRTFTVAPQSATFALNQSSFTYTGSAQGPTIVPTPAGATFASGGTTSATNAGSYTATATANGNYTGSNSSLTWSIAAASQTITFNQPATQTYGTALNPGATASSGLAVSYSIVSGPATVAGSTINFTGTGSVTVRASQAGDANYTAAASVDRTFTVNPQPVTFAVSQASFTYNGSAQGPTVVPTPAGATFATGGTLSATNVGSYTATATASGNYTGSNSSLTWSIATGSQTITFSQPATQTYGTPLSPGATASSGLTIAYSIVTGPATVAGNTINFTGTGSVTVRASQGGNANFGAATPVDRTFTVNPQPATFALSQASFTYNGSAQGSTIVPTPAGATFTPGGTVSATNVGSYTATATASGNYTGSNSSLTWSIAIASQTITFAPPAAQTYGTSLSLGATASSGLAVSYSIVSGPATVAGNTINFTGTGSVTVRAAQAGNANYAAAASVDRTFTVNKATPTGSFANRSLDVAISNTYTVLAGDLNAAFTGPAGAAAPTGTITYAIVGPGTAVTSGTVLSLATYTVRASYPGDSNYNATTKDSTWVVTTDADGDSVPGFVETQLGTNPGTTNATDTGAASSLKVHQPN